MRNHNTMKRDAIIKMVAGLVGQPHKVDLKNYDLLITIEIYQVCAYAGQYESKAGVLTTMAFQNICGVSVVDHRFEELKRYNISEIFDPTPKEGAKVEKRDGGEDGEKASEAAKDEKAVDTAETGKEAATDAKPTDENNEGVSSAVKGEASSEANEAKTTGQNDEGGVSAVQQGDAQANASDDSAGAP
jgi:tRNA acetyltransferase TAN1